MDTTVIERPTDVQVYAEAPFSTIYLVTPLTEAGREWISENVSDDATWFGGALAVEHRYITDLVAGMQGDGLEVR